MNKSEEIKRTIEQSCILSMRVVTLKKKKELIYHDIHHNELNPLVPV
jgi:hypothetical protein